MARAELASCQRTSCPRLPHLSLLAGHLALSAGDAAAARAQLASQPPPPRLESFHAFYLGEALFYTRAYAQAASSFSTAMQSPTPALQARARARLGESLLASGDPAAALPHLDRAATELDLPELYAQRAIARAATGDPDGEKADLTTLALKFPAHPDAERAVQRLSTLLPQPFTFEERLTRAKLLLEADPNAALAELSEIQRRKLARGASAKAKAAAIAANALYTLGRDEEADRQVAIARKGQPDVAAEAALLQGKRALKLDQNDRGRELMEKLDNRYTATRPAEEAGFFVGWLDFQAGRYEQAVKGFERFEQRHRRARRRDEGYWFRALCLLRLQRYPEARATLDELMQKMPQSSLLPQALYWSARSRQLEANATDEVAPSYAQLITQFPASFYTWLAQLRMREMGREPPVPFPSPPKTLQEPLPEPLQLAVALNEVGLFRDEADVVQRAIAGVRAPQQALVYGHALQQLGEYGAAHALAARALWAQGFTEKAGEALALFYPRAFASAVEQSSKSEGVDPYLVWAIMRRESAFRPESHSNANARGLMQLVPPTATSLAKLASEPPPDPDELFSPEINIRLGARYLARLVQRFQHPVLVAAAYNGGPSAVLRWTQERGSLPLDLFVEMISFRETRAYVKQVVADLHTYHALYDPAAPAAGTDPLKVPSPLDGGVDF